MKRFKFTLPLSTILIAGVNSTAGATEVEKPMNILFIAVDDMNIWPGAFDGVAITPNIDRLAESGIKFTNAHCVVPASNPSRTALFTGLRPETTGQYNNTGCFRDKKNNTELITLPQFLQGKGYETVSAGKLFHHARGTAEEPNIYSDPASWNIQKIGNVGVGSDAHNEYLNKNGVGKWQGDDAVDQNSYLAKFGVWGPTDKDPKTMDEWKNAQFCADYLAEEHDKPFVLACGVFSPHEPLIAPREYFDMYPIDKIELPELPEDDFDDIPNIARTNFSTPFVELIKKKGEWRRAVQGYLASISFADHTLGIVLDALENSEYADNTIVIFFSDNGFQLCHKDRWEKYSLWRMATNTPMIMRVPDADRGVCKRAVSYLDIYPTILDLLNIEKPDFLQGTSFEPQIENVKAKREVPAVVTFDPNNTSVIYENWNLITYKNGEQELYDRSRDLLEFDNLIDEPKYAKIVERLSKFIPKPEN